MNDVQSTMALVLKPPNDFEAIYQGQDGAIPIPFVAMNASGKYPARDPLAGSQNESPNLENFVSVPLGGTALLIIPKTVAADSGALVTQPYSFDLRWRLRTVTDGITPEMEGSPSKPFNLLPKLGAPSSGASLVSLPVYASETLTPSATGSTRRPLIAAGTYGVMSQGIYDPGSFTGVGADDAGDAALGVTYYPPYLKAVLGTELSIVAYKESGSWDFTDKSAAGDSAFSNIFGVNTGGTRHPLYEGVGILLISLIRNTTP